MSKELEALESIMLRAKEGRNKEQQKYIESNYELVKQALIEQEKKDNLSKHLIVLIERYLGAVSYDIEQSDYGYAIVKDIKQTIKELEEELE